jgi:hypothetical protein
MEKVQTLQITSKRDTCLLLKLLLKQRTREQA